MSDAQRWIWTEHGMERYRAHPLMMDVGGVFVTAEEYEKLKGERDERHEGAESDVPQVPPLPYTQEDFDRLNGPKPEVRVIELEAHNKALAERLDDVLVKDRLKTKEINILTVENRDLAERLKAVEAERDLQCTLKHNLINRLEECTADLAAARAEVDAPEGCYKPGSYMEKLQECIQLERDNHALKHQNTRLRAALEGIRGHGHFLEHHEIQAIIQAALTEPPEPTRGGFAAEQQD